MSAHDALFRYKDNPPFANSSLIFNVGTSVQSGLQSRDRCGNSETIFLSLISFAGYIRNLNCLSDAIYI